MAKVYSDTGEEGQPIVTPRSNFLWKPAPRVSWVKPHPEADSPLSGDYFVQPASERKKVEFGLGLSFTSFTEQLGVAE